MQHSYTGLYDKEAWSLLDCCNILQCYLEILEWRKKKNIFISNYQKRYSDGPF